MESPCTFVHRACVDYPKTPQIRKDRIIMFGYRITVKAEGDAWEAFIYRRFIFFKVLLCIRYSETQEAAWMDANQWLRRHIGRPKEVITRDYDKNGEVISGLL